MTAEQYYDAMRRIRELRAIERERGLAPEHYTELGDLAKQCQWFETREFGSNAEFDLVEKAYRRATS